MAQQLLVGQGLLIIEASRSHSDTPHSVGLFWTSDQPDAETSTWQHSQETDIHAARGIQTHNPSKRAAADPRLRPRARHCDRLCDYINVVKVYRLDGPLLYATEDTVLYSTQGWAVWLPFDEVLATPL
jgi:hypothetical protein